jgi:hypothetical protein
MALAKIRHFQYDSNTREELRHYRYDGFREALSVADQRNATIARDLIT